MALTPPLSQNGCAKCCVLKNGGEACVTVRCVIAINSRHCAAVQLVDETTLSGLMQVDHAVIRFKNSRQITYLNARL
jgi:hypothetical protein